jgi:hypothetical protein
MPQASRPFSGRAGVPRAPCRAHQQVDLLPLHLLLEHAEPPLLVRREHLIVPSNARWISDCDRTSWS